MNDPKRAEIKARIAAAQARERAKSEQSTTERVKAKASDAGDAFTDFVKEHPLAAAAGGVALGILVAGMFKGPRRAAATGGAKAVGLAAIGAEIASSFAEELLGDAKDIGRAGARRAGDLGDAVGDRARAIRRDANYQADRAGDAARIASRETGKKIARAFRRH
ncbi:hypothetical protein [Aurantiacibacter poecillastricola]|uniref:hypothetical protein n=1 Tax=Aurantiacibacter poecillastricola TaxID=3064385 RepID=UPI00273ECFA6|nr:hypothetical protein [Aurantiacibacter sp. 219JJ12-13]MDP5261952.1 hypothetical protein [Aurantiacibacter sp. 219JJ12-13]